MTAFGKVLTSKSNHDEDFIAKRKWEKDWMNSGEDSDDNIQKKSKVSTQLQGDTFFIFPKMITYNSGIFFAKKGLSLPSAGQGLCCYHIDDNVMKNLFIFTYLISN